jgi:hypothetical protein
MGRAGADRVTTDLDQQHRLDAGRGAQRADETARVLDAFDVQENAFGAGVRHHVFEGFTEVHVHRGAQGDDRGEADVVGAGPVEDGRTEGAGLGDQADGALDGAAAGEAGVEPELRAQHAETVGAEQADAVTAGVLDGVLFEHLAARAGIGEAGRDHHGGLGAGAAAGIDNGRDAVGLGGDDHQVEALGDVLDALVTGHAEHLVVLGIDGEQLTFEPRLQHVADEHVAQGIFPFGGADDGDRAGFEEGGEVVLFVHGECSVGAVWAARLSNWVACRGDGMLIGRNFRNFNPQECRQGWADVPIYCDAQRSV